MKVFLLSKTQKQNYYLANNTLIIEKKNKKKNDPANASE